LPGFVFSLLVGFPITLLQRIISPLVVIRVGRINSPRIGHFIQEIDWIANHSYLVKKNIFEIYFLSDKNSANSFFLDFAINRFRVAPKCLIFGIYAWNRAFSNSSKYLIKLPGRIVDCTWMNSTSSPYNPTDEFLKKGNEVMSKLGIPNDAKIVCFFIRDEAYAQDKFPNTDHYFSDYRNCKSEDFQDSFEFLTNLGYYVLRMGNKVSSTVDNSNSRIIDYANWELRSDFGDVFFSYKCQFAICTDSGATLLPLFFRKPVGITNISGFHGLIHTNLVKFITCKRYIVRSNGLSLTLSEILNSEVYQFENQQDFDRAGLAVKSCSQSENLGLTKDMTFLSTKGEKVSLVNLRFQSLLSQKRGVPYESCLSEKWLSENYDFFN